VDRISTSLFYQRATQNMLENQAALSKTQQQLSTGRRILSASDDPAGTVRALDVQRYLETNRQYQTNMLYVRQRLENQDSVLANATDMLQRAYELAVQGNNASVSDSDREAIAYEVDQILSELLSLANTTDVNGEYLFGGTERQAPPFIEAGGGVFQYRGDQLQRQIQISDDRQVADAETGFDMFMSVPASAGGTQSIFATVHAFAEGLRNGSDLSPSIADLQLAMAQISDARTRGGGRLNAVDNQENLNLDVSLTLESQLSEIRDLDYAEAISRMNQQLTALQASQQTYLKLAQLSLFNYL
jgi:flagellar hook-associated protein 3 FlgL